MFAGRLPDFSTLHKTKLFLLRPGHPTEQGNSRHASLSFMFQSWRFYRSKSERGNAGNAASYLRQTIRKLNYPVIFAVNPTCICLRFQRQISWSFSLSVSCRPDIFCYKSCSAKRTIFHLLVRVNFTSLSANQRRANLARHAHEKMQSVFLVLISTVGFVEDDKLHDLFIICQCVG